MKKTVFAIFFLVLSCKSFSSPPVKDTIYNVPGWLIFFEEEIVWVPSSIPSNVKHNVFFHQAIYENGIDCRGFIQAAEYKSFAKRINIKVGTSLRKSSIYIIPVTVKQNESSVKVGSEILMWFFRRGTDEVTIKYQFAPTFHIKDIAPLRKKDIRKLMNSDR